MGFGRLTASERGAQLFRARAASGTPVALELVKGNPKEPAMSLIEVEAKHRLLTRRGMLSRVLESSHTAERTLLAEPEADLPDRASVRENVRLLDNLSEVERRELEEIDRALGRIAGGTYGECEGCGGSIGRHRLRAIPEARYCITCSESLERGHVRHRAVTS
jgi:DnaK suppressor protein